MITPRTVIGARFMKAAGQTTWSPGAFPTWRYAGTSAGTSIGGFPQSLMLLMPWAMFELRACCTFFRSATSPYGQYRSVIG